VTLLITQADFERGDYLASAKSFAISTLVVFLVFSFVACQRGVPKDALKLSPESLKNRQLQTRIFESNDEKMLLTACAALLQDLGFTIVESETPCGVIVSSRDRDVTEVSQVVGSIAMAVLFGVATPIDDKQKVMASLVTKPLDDKRIAVRITFQHMVWNTHKDLVKNEQINDPKIYQEFFSKLSKSVFLVAHEI
jgi:hypothetical protein